MSPTPGTPSRSRALPPVLAATAVVVVLLLRAMGAAHGALLLYVPVAVLAGVVLAQHGRPQDVGRHQIRRELNAGETKVQCVGQGTDQHGLAQPRDAFEQGMPAGEQAGEHAIHDGLLAHDHLAHLGAHPLGVLAEVANELGGIGGFAHCPSRGLINWKYRRT